MGNAEALWTLVSGRKHKLTERLVVYLEAFEQGTAEPVLVALTICDEDELEAAQMIESEDEDSDDYEL